MIEASKEQRKQLFKNISSIVDKWAMKKNFKPSYDELQTIEGVKKYKDIYSNELDEIRKIMLRIRAITKDLDKSMMYDESVETYLNMVDSAFKDAEKNCLEMIRLAGLQTKYLLNKQKDGDSFQDVGDIIETLTTIDKYKTLPILSIHGLMNDKLTNAIIANEPTDKDRNEWNVNVMTKKKPVPVPVIITNDEYKTSKILTQYDLTNCNAIASVCYVAGRNVLLTAKDIFNLRNGIQIDDRRTEPSKKQLDEINASIRKMMQTVVTLDLTEEIKYIKKTKNAKDYILKTAYGEELTPESMILNELCISGRIVSCTAQNGRKVDAYLIDKMPVLYRYNVMKDHIVCMDTELKKNIYYNAGSINNVTEIAEYLYKAINTMKDCKRNNSIKYTTIFEKIGLEPPEASLNPNKYASEHGFKTAKNKKKLNARNKIKSILDEFKKYGFIENYEEKKGDDGEFRYLISWEHQKKIDSAAGGVSDQDERK